MWNETVFWRRAVLLTGSLAVFGAGVSAPRPVHPAPDDARRVAEVFVTRCMTCHGPGGSGPFLLNSYAAVRDRLPTIRNQILSGAMPPTPYFSDHGDMSGAPPLSDEDKVVFQRWLAAGAPEGEPTAWKPPAIMRALPDPAASVTASLPRVGAEGSARAVVVSVPFPAGLTGFSGFRWSTNTPKVVRRIAIGLLGPEEIMPKSFSPASGLAQAMGLSAQGYRTWQLPDGAQWRVEPRSRLLIEAWIQPSGKEETPTLDLEFMAPTGEAGASRVVLERNDFVIEPEEDPTFSLTHTFDRAADLTHVLPQARDFCARIEVILTQPDGRKSTLFDTRRWSTQWGGNFQFPTPVRAEKGAILTANFNYANSQRCPMNEGRVAGPVRSGPGVRDELCRLIFNQVVLAR